MRDRMLSRALFTRDFTLLFSGQAVSVFGDGLFTIALSFAAAATTTPGETSPSAPSGRRACDQAVSVGSLIAIESMLIR